MPGAQPRRDLTQRLGSSVVRGSYTPPGVPGVYPVRRSATPTGLVGTALFFTTNYHVVRVVGDVVDVYTASVVDSQMIAGTSTAQGVVTLGYPYDLTYPPGMSTAYGRRYPADLSNPGEAFLWTDATQDARWSLPDDFDGRGIVFDASNACVWTYGYYRPKDWDTDSYYLLAKFDANTGQFVSAHAPQDGLYEVAVTGSITVGSGKVFMAGKMVTGGQQVVVYNPATDTTSFQSVTTRFSARQITSIQDLRYANGVLWVMGWVPSANQAWIVGLDPDDLTTEVSASLYTNDSLSGERPRSEIHTFAMTDDGSTAYVWSRGVVGTEMESRALYRHDMATGVNTFLMIAGATEWNTVEPQDMWIGTT